MFSFTKTSIPEVIIVEPQVFGDARGFFMETYSKRELFAAGITADFVQDNHSKGKKGVLRGLHFQGKNTQAKLVRVTSGAVYDVAVDIRKNSPNYGKWVGVLLSAENKKQLFVPEGFAHGFLTLEDDTEFLYKCNNFYDPTSEGGIIWNDAELLIDWGKYMNEYEISETIVSGKDSVNMLFSEYMKNPVF